MRQLRVFGLVSGLWPVSLVIFFAACETGPASQTLLNENTHLHGVIRSQTRRINDLSEQRNDLERRVSLLEVDAPEEVVKPAPVENVPVENTNPDVNGEVQQMLERFKSDSDIEVEQTKDGYRFVMREKVLLVWPPSAFSVPTCRDSQNI